MIETMIDRILLMAKDRIFRAVARVSTGQSDFAQMVAKQESDALLSDVYMQECHTPIGEEVQRLQIAVAQLRSALAPFAQYGHITSAAQREAKRVWEETARLDSGTPPPVPSVPALDKPSYVMGERGRMHQLANAGAGVDTCGEFLPSALTARAGKCAYCGATKGQHPADPPDQK